MVTLIIEILSGHFKEKQHVFALGGVFMDEVAFGGVGHWDPKSLLTPEECDAINPNYFDASTRQITPRDPKPIRDVFIKLYDYIRSDSPSHLKGLEQDLVAAIRICEQAIDTGSMVEWDFDR
jgi:hypothetical protein